MTHFLLLHEFHYELRKSYTLFALHCYRIRVGLGIP